MENNEKLNNVQKKGLAKKRGGKRNIKHETWTQYLRLQLKKVMKVDYLLHFRVQRKQQQGILN